MLTKVFEFVKRNKADIILIIGIILVSLFSFAFGYITAKEEQKESLKFEINNNSDKGLKQNEF
jgi:hypothetical protein